MPMPQMIEIERRVEQCRAESKRAVERAEAICEQETRAEYLKIAGEWLMVAEAVAKTLV